MTSRDIGHLRGDGARGGEPESSRLELDEKRRPKRLAFSEGVLAIEPSERIRGGKADLQKLFEMFLARGQKFLSEGESRSAAHFLLVKELLASRIISLHRFRAERKLVRVIGEREFFQALYAMSRSLMAREQEPSNHGLWGENDLVEDGIYIYIPSVITAPTFSAEAEAFSGTKHDSFQR